MLTSSTTPQSTLAPKAQLFTLALAALIAPTTTAFAVGTNYINDGTLMVPVGDVGNQANTDGFGGVPYGYSIGKYAVTNAQYAKFLNAVDPAGLNALDLYNDNMAGTYGGIVKTDSADEGSKYAVKSGTDTNGMSYGDKPVNYVSFWDAARFCNWLTNGGGTVSGGGGDATAIAKAAAAAAALTETGMYTLDRTVNPTNSDVTRNVVVNGSTLTGTGKLSGKSQTVYAVSSENEWYKAAYYNGDGSYREYPVTAESLSQTVANYYSDGYAFEEPRIAAVDYYDSADGADSYYGTFQQSGNVFEWNDTITSETTRGMRGGSFGNDGDFLASSASLHDILCSPSTEFSTYGFRVSSLLITSVPEPGTYGLLGGAAALLGAVALRRRPRRD